MKSKTYCAMVYFFDEYLSARFNIVNILKPFRETGKSFEERRRRGNKEVDKNAEIFCMNNKTIISFGFCNR